ncbi:nuclear transport factor 2 family protein [Rhizobium sp. OAE497]|uniref:nuclear transport factor 2 family protein n=1 Tax=Rhizobium sp. OAE497 TaxID=2663796 RepID=UPI0018F3AE72
MNTTHVDTYFQALANRDKAGIVPHLSENIVLLGPIFPEPTEGREAVVGVLSGFLDTIDSLDVDLSFASGRDVAVFFAFTCNGIKYRRK